MLPPPYNIRMNYDNSDSNTCSFTGKIISPLALSYKSAKNNPQKQIPYLDFTILSNNTPIPCIAIGSFALKLHVLLAQGDSVYISSSFAPINKPNEPFVFRFLISSLVITQKLLSPIALSHNDSNPHTLDLLNSI
jgi:hypothetical protein